MVDFYYVLPYNDGTTKEIMDIMAAKINFNKYKFPKPVEKSDFVTTYYYKAGKTLYKKVGDGVILPYEGEYKWIDEEDIEDLVHDDDFNIEAYDQAVLKYEKEHLEVLNQFKKDALESLGLSKNKKGDALFEVAWNEHKMLVSNMICSAVYNKMEKLKILLV